MRKDFGSKPYLFPMPVIMIATYDENEKVDVMNMAWGGIAAEDMVAMNLDEDHKTVKNIKINKAFTLAIADIKHLKEADYFGIASGNDVPDKFERTGLKAVKSKLVNAPVLVDFPVTLECKAIEMENRTEGFKIIGKILNVSADSSVLDEKGRISVEKIHAFSYDPFTNGYYEIGKRIGQAWHDGLVYRKK